MSPGRYSTNLRQRIPMPTTVAMDISMLHADNVQHRSPLRHSIQHGSMTACTMDRRKGTAVTIGWDASELQASGYEAQ